MLATYITKSQVKSVKSDLLHHNKEHKLLTSSHLTEALAFAFGFNTNAAALACLASATSPQCVEFSAERFWRRLSELAGISTSNLQSALDIDLSKSVSRAIETRDLRERITLPFTFKTRLEKFFKLMADHGAAYFTMEGTRLPPNDFGFSGSYRPGRQAMRSRFSLTKPSLNWQWNNSDWNALMADDFLEDHAGSDCDLPRWAVTACGLLERDLTLGNVVFNSDIGLVVHHEEIEGCSASILYQRLGQLEDVRAADARQEKVNLLQQ